MYNVFIVIKHSSEGGLVYSLDSKSCALYKVSSILGKQVVLLPTNRSGKKKQFANLNKIREIPEKTLHSIFVLKSFQTHV